jgi:hypothetical protein
MCANFSTVEIIDLWDRRVARPKTTFENRDDITEIGRIGWSSPSVLEYDAVIHGYTACREGKFIERPVKGSIDLATLQFR